MSRSFTKSVFFVVVFFPARLPGKCHKLCFSIGKTDDIWWIAKFRGSAISQPVLRNGWLFASLPHSTPNFTDKTFLKYCLNALFWQFAKLLLEILCSYFFCANSPGITCLDFVFKKKKKKSQLISILPLKSNHCNSWFGKRKVPIHSWSFVNILKGKNILLWVTSLKKKTQAPDS